MVADIKVGGWIPSAGIAGKVDSLDKEDDNGGVGARTFDINVDEAGRNDEDSEPGECRWRMRSMLVKAGK
jgi:hypothetical protein